MGLDMYLTAKRHLSHRQGDDELSLQIGKLVCGRDVCIGTWSVEARVGYWRKANAIHRWFVKNVQNGMDKCREHAVERKALLELLDLCLEALADKQAAVEKDLLPPQGGFFFGSLKRDEYYWETLEDTVKILQEATSEEKWPENKWDFYYLASW